MDDVKSDAPVSPSEAEIRKALEAGPTPGPWYGRGSRIGNDFGIIDSTKQYVLAETFSDIRRQGEGALREAGANALLIAACNPAAIRALLAELDALRASAVPVPAAQQGAQVAAPVVPTAWIVTRLIRRGDEASGRVRYLRASEQAARAEYEGWLDVEGAEPTITPLYVGAPPVQEQDAEDAARYRWLRDAPNILLRASCATWTRPDGTQFRDTHFLCAYDTQYAPHPSLDEAIDAAIDRAVLAASSPLGG